MVQFQVTGTPAVNLESAMTSSSSSGFGATFALKASAYGISIAAPVVVALVQTATNQESSSTDQFPLWLILSVSAAFALVLTLAVAGFCLYRARQQSKLKTIGPDKDKHPAEPQAGPSMGDSLKKDAHAPETADLDLDTEAASKDHGTDGEMFVDQAELELWEEEDDLPAIDPSDPDKAHGVRFGSDSDDTSVLEQWMESDSDTEQITPNMVSHLTVLTRCVSDVCQSFRC